MVRKFVEVQEDELETVVENDYRKDERSRRMKGKGRDKARHNRGFDDEDDGWN